MDIRTLLVCLLGLLMLHTAALLLLYLSERGLVGIGWLAASLAAFTAGIGLGAGRGGLPDFASIVLGNGLVALGYVLLHRTVTEFLGLERRHLAAQLVLLVVAVGLASYFTYATNDVRVRIALLSVSTAAQAGISAALALRAPATGALRRAERFLGGVLAVLASLSLLRGGLTLWRGAPADFMRSDAVQAASLLAFILGSAALVFGFVWMTNARLRLALHHQAMRDPLTGLLNRRGFLDRAPEQLRAAAEDGRTVLLLFADLDGLKQVNDTHGHDAGDRAIREAAEVLREAMRASDAIARLGGDEFCALIPVSVAGDGEVILQRLEKRVRMHNARPGREYTFGISAALTAINPTERRPLEELLRAADHRMYAAKRARQGRAPHAPPSTLPSPPQHRASSG